VECVTDPVVNSDSVLPLRVWKDNLSVLYTLAPTDIHRLKVSNGEPRHVLLGVPVDFHPSCGVKNAENLWVRRDCLFTLLRGAPFPAFPAQLCPILSEVSSRMFPRLTEMWDEHSWMQFRWQVVMCLITYQFLFDVYEQQLCRQSCISKEEGTAGRMWYGLAKPLHGDSQ